MRYEKPLPHCHDMIVRAQKGRGYTIDGCLVAETVIPIFLRWYVARRYSIMELLDNAKSDLLFYINGQEVAFDKMWPVDVVDVYLALFSRFTLYLQTQK